MEIKAIGKDAAGYVLMTRAVKSLLNQFPGLNGRTITFEDQTEEDSISFFADAGALVIAERRSITDHVTQTCQFPFMVIYRTAATREFQKFNVSQFLESLGKWICKEPVEINGTIHRLYSYPEISGDRKITRIFRDNYYGIEPKGEYQEWALPVSVQYTYEFDM